MGRPGRQPVRSFVRLSPGAKHLSVRKDCLPVKGGDHPAFLEMEVLFGEPHEQDPLYCRAEIPEGWDVRIVSDGKAYELIDEKGRARAFMACNSAPDRRRAEIYPLRYIDFLVRMEDGGGRRAVVKRLGHAMYKTKTLFREEGERTPDDRCSELAGEWLDKHYSKWRSYTAYWD